MPPRAAATCRDSPRCSIAALLRPDCERDYDTWTRRYASDIVWPVLAGMVILSAVALGLPLLGAGYVVATTGVFAGFGTLVGLQRLNARRRRKQFQLASLPRAYLPSKT